MKTFFYSVLFCFFIVSCKKQAPSMPQGQSAASIDSVDSNYLRTVQGYLEENMSDSSYGGLSWDQPMLSKEGDIWFLRLAWRSRSMAERFLLLSTDSTGHVAGVRDISLTRDPLVPWSFNGVIASRNLKGTLMSSNTVTNGYMENDRVRQPGSPAVNSTEENFLVPAIPVQDLPEVVVVGYSGGGGSGLSLSDYIYLSGLSGMGGSGGAGTGGAGSGGSVGGSGGSGSIAGIYAPLRPAGGITEPITRPSSGRPETINIETSYAKPGINVAAYLKCFAGIPDADASYSVSLFVDLPVNDDPTQIFNQLTGAVGHCFLGLSKTGSGQSVTQYFGFVSTQPFPAIAGTVTPGKVVDNSGHRFNGSYAIPVNAMQFTIAMSSITRLSTSNYDLNNFNCIDFALSVVNSFRPTTPIVPAPVQMPAAGISIDTPQGLYITLQHIQNTGGSALVGSVWNAGAGHGPCN